DRALGCFGARAAGVGDFLGLFERWRAGLSSSWLAGAVAFVNLTQASSVFVGAGSTAAGFFLRLVAVTVFWAAVFSRAVFLGAVFLGAALRASFVRSAASKSSTLRGEPSFRIDSGIHMASGCVGSKRFLTALAASAAS